jgi:hypothetical protein
MTDPIAYTAEDRDMLRSVRDALLGTFSGRGLITKLDEVERKIDTHISEGTGAAAYVAEVATRVAKGVAADAIVAATKVAAEAVVTASRGKTPWQFVVDVAMYATASSIALLATWAAATFWLGLKLSIGHPGP